MLAAQGQYNAVHGDDCKQCPKDQTSTKPFHSCHCKPGFFNTSYISIRCFEPQEPYFPEEPSACAPSANDPAVWDGDCCRPCPKPAFPSKVLPVDYPFPNEECIQCTQIAHDVDEYGNPAAGHGVMTPHIMPQFSVSTTGWRKYSQYIASVGRKPRGSSAELNVFRCPFQRDGEAERSGPCLGHYFVYNATSNETSNETSTEVSTMAASKSVPETTAQTVERMFCKAGYGGALCGSCADNYTKTTDGCQKCDGSGGLYAVFLVLGMVISSLGLLVVIVRFVVHHIKADIDDDDTDDETTDEEQEEVPGHEERVVARNSWRRARALKHVVGLKLTFDLVTAANKIGHDALEAVRKESKTIARMLTVAFASAKTSAKTAVGLGQVLSSLPSVLDLKFPAEFLALLSSIGAVNFDIFAIFRVDCVAKTDIYTRFIAIMLLPPTLIVLLKCVEFYKVFRVKCKGHLTASEQAAEVDRMSSATTGRCLAVLFFLYPTLSSTVFRMFVCRELDYGERWHRDQYSIDCNSPKHEKFQAFAIMGALVYPFGVPATFFFMMYRHREALSGGNAKHFGNMYSQTDEAAVEPPSYKEAAHQRALDHAQQRLAQVTTLRHTLQDTLGPSSPSPLTSSPTSPKPRERARFSTALLRTQPGYIDTPRARSLTVTLGRDETSPEAVKEQARTKSFELRHQQRFANLRRNPAASPSGSLAHVHQTPTRSADQVADRLRKKQSSSRTLAASLDLASRIQGGADADQLTQRTDVQIATRVQIATTDLSEAKRSPHELLPWTEPVQGAQICAQNIGIQGWDNTSDGRSLYENETALCKLFKRFGPCVRATVHHQFQDADTQTTTWRQETMTEIDWTRQPGGWANTSWALLTFARPEDADTALARGLTVGTTTLVLSKFEANSGKTLAGFDEVCRRDEAKRIKRTMKLQRIKSHLVNVANSMEDDTTLAHAQAAKARWRQLQSKRIMNSFLKRKLVKARMDMKRREFEFLSHDYQPRYYYFECVFLVEKLILTGLLIFVEPGTVTQCYVATLTALIFCLIQTKFMPYVSRTQNILKLLCEVQLLMTLIVAIVLRTDLSNDSISASGYDAILVSINLLLVPAFMIVIGSTALVHIGQQIINFSRRRSVAKRQVLELADANSQTRKDFEKQAKDQINARAELMRSEKVKLVEQRLREAKAKAEQAQAAVEARQLDRALSAVEAENDRQILLLRSLLAASNAQLEVAEAGLTSVVSRKGMAMLTATSAEDTIEQLARLKHEHSMELRQTIRQMQSAPEDTTGHEPLFLSPQQDDHSGDGEPDDTLQLWTAIRSVVPLLSPCLRSCACITCSFVS
jgi:hypothetical protein